MLLEHNTWPQTILGPKLLNKKELVEYIVCYHLFGSDKSLEDNLKYQRTSLASAKIRLNNYYSYLKRLEIDNDELYKAYVRKLRKENLSIKRFNKNIEENIKNFFDIIQNHNTHEINDMAFYSILNCHTYENKVIAPKSFWLNSEIIACKNNINHEKKNIEFYIKDINKKISQYHKLKNQLMT